VLIPTHPFGEDVVGDVLSADMESAPFDFGKSGIKRLVKIT
jgi:hypothetical protein